MDILNEEDVELIKRTDVSKLSEYELNKFKVKLEEYSSKPEDAVGARGYKVKTFVFMGIALAVGMFFILTFFISLLAGSGGNIGIIIGAVVVIPFFIVSMVNASKHKKAKDLAVELQSACDVKLREIHKYMQSSGMNVAGVASACDKCGYVYNGSESFCPKCGAERKII